MRGISILCFAGAMMVAPLASADVLDGQNVSANYYYPTLANPYAPTTYAPQNFVVGAGQESTIVIEGVTTFNVDFSGSALNLAFDTVLGNPTFTGAAFNGLVFTSTAFAGVTGVAIGAGSNFAGFDASRVSIVGNELRLNWNGLAYDTGTVLNLTFAAVPEPASWALMIVGIGGLGATLRRRRARMSVA